MLRFEKKLTSSDMYEFRKKIILSSRTFFPLSCLFRQDIVKTRTMKETKKCILVVEIDLIDLPSIKHELYHFYNASDVLLLEVDTDFKQ